MQAAIYCPHVSLRLQSALLYTNVAGQRVIRVHTLALPLTDNIATVFKGADLDAQVRASKLFPGPLPLVLIFTRVLIVYEHFIYSSISLIECCHPLTCCLSLQPPKLIRSQASFHSPSPPDLHPRPTRGYSASRSTDAGRLSRAGQLRSGGHPVRVPQVLRLIFVRSATHPARGAEAAAAVCAVPSQERGAEGAVIRWLHGI